MPRIAARTESTLSNNTSLSSSTSEDEEEEIDDDDSQFSEHEAPPEASTAPATRPAPLSTIFNWARHKNKPTAAGPSTPPRGGGGSLNCEQGTISVASNAGGSPASARFSSPAAVPTHNPNTVTPITDRRSFAERESRV